MSRLNIPNVSAVPVRTHEGAVAVQFSHIKELRRAVLSCLLWEDSFYESGQSTADRIKSLVPQCNAKDVYALAIQAREEFNLRHVPLLLLRELARIAPRPGDQLLSKTLARVIQRPDELAEFLAMYWEDKKQPLAKQVKRGLAWAFRKFNAYELAKYNRDNKVRLRDVLFLTHPKPKDQEQALLWKALAENKLATPDTWEVQLSAGKDKKETFERLLTERKLGYFALLRNLRNMLESGCNRQLVAKAILERKGGAERVLPFRFIAAARAAVQFEPELDMALQANLKDAPRLRGLTFVLVDNSGSMYAALSGKSDMMRADAACGVAIVARSLCENARVFAFSDSLVEVPPRSGMSLRDAIQGATNHGSTFLGQAIQALNKGGYDRLIVITDEQSHDEVPLPKTPQSYLINVASYQHGIGYGPWVRMNGFSEAVFKFIQEYEREEAQD